MFEIHDGMNKTICIFSILNQGFRLYVISVSQEMRIRDYFTAIGVFLLFIKICFFFLSKKIIYLQEILSKLYQDLNTYKKLNFFILLFSVYSF